MAYPQVAFTNTKIAASSLVGRRRAAAAVNTLEYQLQVLKDTGRYDAFKLQWHPTYNVPPLVWPIPDHLFWDSDVAKWIEGACYFLHEEFRPQIDAAVRDLVDMIRSAQQEDGYINIHYTVVEPARRFTNLKDMHELYNAGHLIEAALAHNQLYHNDLLLEPVERYVDLLCATFGPGEEQQHGYPGHSEIELALLRLYERTGNDKQRQLAEYFIQERGNPIGCEGRHFFTVEAERRQDDPNKKPAYYPEPNAYWYHQAHDLIANQQTIEGHSVRAMYLLAAVADLARSRQFSKEEPLAAALYRLWNNMVNTKMYVTGGIGAIKQWEGFGLEYFLPQGTDEGGCYSETCAAIGVMMLAERLLKIDLDCRFADIMEICLYNAVLTAMSHDGKQFAYENQLASSEADQSKRESWFTVACCPPNVLRLLGQIGGYIWQTPYPSHSEPMQATVHLFVPSSLRIQADGHETCISQGGDWPWKEEISFTVQPAAPVLMKLRIPGWAEDHQMNPPCPRASLKDGYLTLPDDWVHSNPKFTLSIPLKIRWVAQNPLTRQNTVSLMRGPVVYCVEDFDNTWVTDHFKTLEVDTQAELKEQQIVDHSTGDEYIQISLMKGARTIRSAQDQRYPFYSANVSAASDNVVNISELHFIPYHFRANRQGKGHMRVGLRRWNRISLSS